MCLFELSFYAEKKQKRHRFCSDFYAYDLLITNQLLYQLSYTSISPANRIIPELSLNVNKKVYQETENLSL